MKKITVLMALAATSSVFGQNLPLPKSIKKNWVPIPALEFQLNGFQGNDSVNFMNSPHKIKTEDFFIFRTEVTNHEYREFVNAVQNSGMWPDTNSWNTDFVLAYNDPLRKQYFCHPKYHDYPVVGVSQIQALAYCDWLQKKLNQPLNLSVKNKYSYVVSLPSEKQWQSAFYYSFLKDEKYGSHFTWMLEHKLLITKGKYNLNYGMDITKEGMGIYDYMIDGGMYPLAVNHYKPSKCGIYNLMGNVAEWTLSPAYNTTDSSRMYFNEETKQIISYLKSNGKEYFDTSKSYDYYNNPYNLKSIYERDGFKAIKGGSWCHSTFYLQPEVSIYFKPTEQHSYIGFRPVLTLVRKE